MHFRSPFGFSSFLHLQLPPQVGQRHLYALITSHDSVNAKHFTVEQAARRRMQLRGMANLKLINSECDSVRFPPRQMRCRMVEPASFGRQTLYLPRVRWSVLASGAYEVGRALRPYISQSFTTLLWIVLGSVLIISDSCVWTV